MTCFNLQLPALLGQVLKQHWVTRFRALNHVFNSVAVLFRFIELDFSTDQDATLGVAKINPSVNQDPVSFRNLDVPPVIAEPIRVTKPHREFPKWNATNISEVIFPRKLEGDDTNIGKFAGCSYDSINWRVTNKEELVNFFFSHIIQTRKLLTYSERDVTILS